MKQVIKLTESDLRRIVYDSIYQILERKQGLNEGWKNWAMAGALGAASMFGNPQTANAQNYVFNSIKDPNVATGQKIDELVLDANKPIKYNYDLIKQRMSLHREKNYAEYIILCKGRYTNKKGQSCNKVDIDCGKGMIYIKGEGNERHRTIDGQIIHALTGLYSQSLDDEFDLPSGELQWYSGGADYREIEVPVLTIRTNSGISGGVYRKARVAKHRVYALSETSPTWKKIYNKVIEETGLKDGGAMYDLDYKLGRIDGKNHMFDDDQICNSPEEMPSFPGGSSALFEYLSKSVDSNYPVVAQENGVQGRVVVNFVVERDGSIGDVKIVKSVDPSLDIAAKKVINGMPHWIPGKQNGHPVRVKYTVPITFRLQ